jgi:glutamyl-Q tRNA(Asp) synthetase
MVVSRFAPAPTGYLHLGHVLNALHVWGLTRALNGRVLLRIEDHDRQRSRDVYERAIVDDLDWFGFVPDDPATDAFREGVCRGRQRDRHDLYEAAYARLQSAGLLYACDCSRRELRSTLLAGDAPEGERRYSGRCAARNLSFTSGRGIRVRFGEEVERFDDLRHGPQVQQPSEQCGDMLIRDREENWTYQFAVTVDDMQQGVTLVIRGDDLLASTGRQIKLARLLGRGLPPRFLHHPLIMRSPDQKLSKADRDTSVGDMRESGLTAADVFGRTLHAAGFAESPDPVSRETAEDRVVARYRSAIERVGGEGAPF